MTETKAAETDLTREAASGPFEGAFAAADMILVSLGSEGGYEEE